MLNYCEVTNLNNWTLKFIYRNLNNEQNCYLSVTPERCYYVSYYTWAIKGKSIIQRHLIIGNFLRP